MRFSIVVAIGLSLSACSANYKAIHKVTNLKSDTATVMTVDAKQRAIISNYQKSLETVATGSGATGRTTTTELVTRRFCSEPSPDVFSVVAQSLSVGGSFGQTADPRAIEAALNAAFSSSENGTTIARTQANNLLREIMFRTCERYMNGAIGELEMSVQAARDQRVIVSLLAIEQLTGAVTPRPVVIGASGSATAGASADAIMAIEDARKSLESAKAGAEAASTAFDEVNTAEKICEADPVLDENKAKCTEKLDARTREKEKFGKASERYQLLSSLARAGGGSASTSLASEAPGGTLGVQPDAIEDVALAVLAIVKANMDTDEFGFFCIKYFADPQFKVQLTAASAPPEILGMCSTYMLAGIEAEAVARFSQERYDSAVQSISGRTNAAFDRFWSRVETGGKFDKAKFLAAVAAISPQPVGRDKLLVAQISGQTGKEDIARNFAIMSGRIQTVLAGGEAQ